MDLYSVLRAFADSWFLIAMVGFFAGAVLWAWRPGAARLQSAAANIPFSHDEAPAPSRPKGLKS